MDPQVRAYLDRMAASGLPPYSQLSPMEARRLFDATVPVLAGPSPPVHRVEDLLTAGVRTRVYAPRSTVPLPITVYFHGGGWVLGNLESHDSVCRRLATMAGSLVVSVDYRLAPEHRFPAAVEDAWSVTSWLVANGSEIGGDPQRLAVAGDSAGGNLAAVVALKARDAGLPIRLQVLVYPVTDTDLDTASYLANGTGYSLTRDSMAWYFDQYLPDVGTRSHPDAAPLKAHSMAGVAPALVVVCDLDPLLDEGEAYASRLESSGVPVILRRYTGMIHGFIRMFAVVDRSHELVRKISSALQAAFQPLHDRRVLRK